MSISATDLNKKTTLRYSFVSLFCLVFGLMYELFSNGVYSLFMMFAFALPLFLGALPFFMFWITKTQSPPSLHSRYIYHSGIATLTVGSIVQGVLEIYGTTNQLIYVYLYVGAALVGAGVVAYVVDLVSKKTK